MNDQPAPQVPQQTTPTDQEKELADTALRETGILTDTPVEQPSTDSTPSIGGDPTSDTPAAVENTYDSNGIVSAPPELDDSTTPVSPIVEPSTPVASTPTVEIPVNDNTVVTPEETTTPVASEPVQETSTSEPLTPQVEPLSTLPPEEAQPTPTVIGSAQSTGQAPAQPEGFMAKFLHIFKK